MADPIVTGSHVARLPESTASYSPFDSALALIRILDQYLADLQAGRAPDRAQLLAGHPELAGQLEQCLAGIEFVHRVAKPQVGTPAQLGDFRIVREIGRGGMGVVYEAEQVSLKRKVALKVLRFGVGPDAEVMKRFQREAETLAHLHHTNIVPIFAVGCEQGVHYYAMQFIEGRSLADEVKEGLKAQGAPPVGLCRFLEIARWGLQAAEALTHAHQRGVIHRDIKPSNLLLDPEGTIWLTDFGLAKRADEVTLTAAGVLMGTPRYMSPEQAASVKQPIDHRTDIYSLGATLYELATGKPVFDADTPQGVLSQIQNVEPVPPRQLQVNLPRDLETIILKCLAKEATGRYPTAQDLAEDLRSFQLGRAIKARRPRLVERSLRWVRKQKRSLIIGTTAAVLSAVVAAGSLFVWVHQRDKQLGCRISLSTDSPPLTAEVLDEKDELLVPRFTVPTAEPVLIPTGTPRLRFSGPGQLSETYRTFTNTEFAAQGNVTLGKRQLWPPIAIKPGETCEIVEMGGRADVIMLGDRTVSRIDGTTGTQLWSSGLESGPYRVLRKGTDLDGDGIPDLLLASKRNSSLLALSGKDGKAIWSRTSTEDEADRQLRTNWRAVLGKPLVADVRGDGNPYVIAVFGAENQVFGKGNVRNSTGLRISAWIEAISGHTGKTVWRHTIDLSMIEELRTEERIMCHTATLKIGEHTAVSVLCENHSALLNLKTGKPLRPQTELSFHPIRRAQLMNGDEPSLLLLRRVDEKRQALVAVSLKTGAVIWEKEFAGSWVRIIDPYTPLPEWPAVVDLDGDGKSQAIIIDNHQGKTLEENWLQVIVIDSTGQVRWRHRLDKSMPVADGIGGRVIVGPDIDGDGHRDVFVSALLQREFPFSSWTVRALSGKDGHPLWEWRRPSVHHTLVHNPVGLMSWWQQGADNWPQLVVPIKSETANIHSWSLAILFAGTGRLAHVLPEFGHPHTADLDGDGILDMYGEMDGKLLALRGSTVDHWRWMQGDWQPIHDWDGDGIPDILTDWHKRWLLVASGRDGHILREIHTGYIDRRWYFPHGDVNGDGVPDIFLSGFDKSSPVLQAICGKTGQVLWKTDLGLTRDHRQQGIWLECRDLDGDGRPELMFAYNLWPDFDHRQLWVACLSAQDGQLKWKQPITESMDWPILNVVADFHPSLGDLNGDGVLDLAVWGSSKDNKPEIRVLSGTDGTSLWARPLSNRMLDWPGSANSVRAVLVADLDGNGKAPVVVIAGGRGFLVNEEGPEIWGLDGRTGERKWTYKLPRESFTDWMEFVLVDLGNGRRGVSLLPRGVRSPSRWDVLVLDGQGRPCQQSWIDWAGADQPAQRFRSYDVDGDGVAEVFLIRDGKLRVTSCGVEQLLWEWPLPGGTGNIIDILPGLKESPAIIVIGMKGQAFGVDGRTGRPRWHCQGPGEAYAVLPTDDPRDLPRVLFRDRDPKNASNANTICRQALPIRPVKQEMKLEREVN